MVVLGCMVELYVPIVFCMNLKTSLHNVGKVDHFGWVKCIF